MHAISMRISGWSFTREVTARWETWEGDYGWVEVVETDMLLYKGAQLVLCFQVISPIWPCIKYVLPACEIGHRWVIGNGI